MSYSYNFLLHLIAFGFAAAANISLFILNKKLCAEQDWGKRLYLGGVMRTFAMFGPYTIAILLLTGFGNMINRYGMYSPWPMEHWLMTKIALFLLLAFNSMYIAPRISIKRMMLIKSVVEKNGPENADALLAGHNKKITNFLYIQSALLLAIVILAEFSGKHPGVF